MYHRWQRIFFSFFSNLFKVVQNCVFSNSGSIPLFFGVNTMQYEHKDTKDTRWQRTGTLWKRAAVTLFSLLSCLQHITLDSYIPCLTDLCKALWEVMLSYHRTMQWHEEHDKQEASPTGKRLYLCDRVSFSLILFIFSHKLLFVLTWCSKKEQFPVQTHCHRTCHNPQREPVTVYVLTVINSSSYFYLHCEQSLRVTCCLGQLSTLNLLIKH